MPQVIPFAVTAIATAAGASPLLVGALTLVASIAVGSYTQGQAKKKARAEYNAAQVDRFANVVATMAPRELVLGRVRKGGSVAFRATTGQYSSTFYVHLTLAAHEIDAVEEIWFNDQRVTINPATGAIQEAPYTKTTTKSAQASIYPGATSVTLPFDPLPGVVAGTPVTENSNIADAIVPVTVSGRTVSIPWPMSQRVDISYQYVEYTNRAWCWIDLGFHGLADGATLAAFPGMWTSAHRGIGIAKLIAVFQYDDSAFPSGPPSITVVMRGAKVYDPRTGLTQWSDNPALLSRHVYQHPQFGKATVTAAEDARFIAAANACDATHAWNVNGVTDTQKLYRAGTVVPFGTPAASVLDDLCQAMAGMWVFAGGELFIRAGAYTAPVADFGDSDQAVIQREGESDQQSRISIVPHRERVQKFNVVNARIWDASQQYKRIGLTPLKGASLIARDGQELAQEVEMPAVSFAPQALHIAGVMMRDARDPLTIEVPLKMTAYAVELLDTITLSFSRYGWDASPKSFIVLGRVWDRMRGVIRLTCKETTAAIFTPDAAFLPGGYADNTALPNPWNIAPPSRLTISSGTSELMMGKDGTVVARVRISWPEIDDPRIKTDGKVEIQWCRATVGQWTSITVDGDVTQTMLTGLADGVAILVRARTRTKLAVSDWGMQVLHVVVGKTEPPSSVSFFTIEGDTLRWSEVPDLDLAGYEIRFNYGNSTFWDSAVPLHAGLLTSSPYKLVSRPVGLCTLLIKAVDTSGNKSASASSIVVDLGDVPINNILFSFEEAPTFAGEITNGAVSGGVLQATATDSFYGGDNEPFYGPPASDFYDASTYEQLQYVFSRVISDAGTVLLQQDVSASNFTVEYLRDNGEPFYGDDDDAFYGDDAEFFYGTASEWASWPGYLVLASAETITWRVTTAAGPTRGEISTLTVILDVPDVVEEFEDVVIAAGGTRLPITETYRSILNVLVTVQTDGNGGVNARIEDKDATNGPLITVRNASGTSVDGLIDARIRGI